MDEIVSQAIVAISKQENSLGPPMSFVVGQPLIRVLGLADRISAWGLTAQDKDVAG
jgi:hypothetical protein